ncbi:MAG: spermidine/putrescine ABC transporter ATP-binding protein, partial [Treponema sp.]|nr:spermidine/putrescine ABC transporter ATP-binding protein [Treponema sp.]
VREENIILTPAKDGGDGLHATITGKNFVGGLLRINARLQGDAFSQSEEICASIQGIESPFNDGDEVLVSWLPSNAVKVARD